MRRSKRLAYKALKFCLSNSLEFRIKAVLLIRGLVTEFLYPFRHREYISETSSKLFFSENDSLVLFVNDSLFENWLCRINSTSAGIIKARMPPFLSNLSFFTVLSHSWSRNARNQIWITALAIVCSVGRLKPYFIGSGRFSLFWSLKNPKEN